MRCTSRRERRQRCCRLLSYAWLLWRHHRAREILKERSSSSRHIHSCDEDSLIPSPPATTSRLYHRLKLLNIIHITTGLPPLKDPYKNTDESQQRRDSVRHQSEAKSQKLNTTSRDISPEDCC